MGRKSLYEHKNIHVTQFFNLGNKISYIPSRMLIFLFSLQIGPARFRAPELLFRPDLIGEECEGLHEVLVFAIQKSDMDLRRTLFSNIVLSGGSTLFKGSS